MVRQRQAHRDAKLSTTIRSIALTFGLPAEAIRLCHRNGRKMRGNASVNTLRKVWAPKPEKKDTEVA